MDNTTSINKLLSFLVKNSYTFTVGVMCAAHFVLLIIMLVSGVMPLMFFNILSVVVYIFCFLLCKFGHIMPVYISIILEVTVYTVVSTYFIGLRCGTYCFLFSIIPIIIYFGSNIFKGKQRWGVVLMLVLNFAVFVALYIRFAPIEPVYDLPPVTKLVLVVFSSFCMIFSTMFYNMIYIYMSENEVTSLERANRRLTTDASEDALTNLLNRRGFLPIIKELMHEDNKEPFCVAFIDLDNFKTINDSYGHEAGDEVLKHVTNIITEELRGCDVCRWGGEEIVILLKGYDLSQAREKMENVRRRIETDPTLFFNKKLFITATIGLAERDASLLEPEQVIKVADDRMYYGKQHGKNVLIYEDMY